MQDCGCPDCDQDLKKNGEWWSGEWEWIRLKPIEKDDLFVSIIILVLTLALIISATYFGTKMKLRPLSDKYVPIPEDMSALRKKHRLLFATLLIMTMLLFFVSIFISLFIFSEYQLSLWFVFSIMLIVVVIVPQFAIHFIHSRRGDDWYDSYIFFLNKSYGIDYVRVYNFLSKVCIWGANVIALVGLIDSILKFNSP